MYTNIPKPTGATYTNVGAYLPHYDEPTVLFDDPTMFYDGFNQAAYTNVSKPISSSYTKISKPS